ncbi:hypothetical protein BS78_09G061800 [Paspalum vaginatum]|nr:hypothetical protein BS78_09G061800 [Paspalum vaginatum]
MEGQFCHNGDIKGPLVVERVGALPRGSSGHHEAAISWTFLGRLLRAHHHRRRAFPWPTSTVASSPAAHSSSATERCTVRPCRLNCSHRLPSAHTYAAKINEMHVRATAPRPLAPLSPSHPPTTQTVALDR